MYMYVYICICMYICKCVSRHIKKSNRIINIILHKKQ